MTVTFAELGGITFWAMLLTVPFILLGAVPWTMFFVLVLVLATCLICHAL